MSDFTASDGTQTEDLFPWAFLAPIVDRYLRGRTISRSRDPTKSSIVEQIKGYARGTGLRWRKAGRLILPGWLRRADGRSGTRPTDSTVAVWELFHQLAGDEAVSKPAAQGGGGRLPAKR